MKKILKPKDILMLTLAEFGDAMQEMRDPLHLVSSAYEKVYGFVPKGYTRRNFSQLVRRSLRTGDIELVIKKGEQYIRLTSAGKEKFVRDFPIRKLTQKWNKKWTILTFDIAEKHHRVRDRLRNKLKGIGFGMLQESIWITPLPIGEDVWELMESFGLSDNTFVMEVSHLLKGNAQELAKTIWKLDVIEEKSGEYIQKLQDIKRSITEIRGRDTRRQGGLDKTDKLKLNELEKKKRALRKECLELVNSLPSLPRELLPAHLVASLRKDLF